MKNPNKKIPKFKMELSQIASTLRATPKTLAVLLRDVDQTIIPVCMVAHENACT
jgi:hypothetical protein